jgi:ABC-type uncharacterized transport system substrate-binding protein
MRRRDFITVIAGSAAVWPLAARAQQTRVYRIGALLVGNADVDSFRKELREELRKSGYIEGQNLTIELRSAEEKLDLLPKLAAELVDLKVDVIVAVYTPCAIAAKQATREIPIVIMAGDPRWSAGNADDTRKYAAELVALAPDVIFVSGSAGVEPLRRATRTVPIVFVLVPDPVGAGFVSSLARPGGTVVDLHVQRHRF